MTRARRNAIVHGALFCAVLLVSAGVAQASGGYGGPGGGYRSPADPTYDRGKALFSGRTREHRGMKVCLSPADSSAAAAGVEISRKKMKPFKKGPVAELAKRLVRCDAPRELIGNRLGSEDFRALLYYMNKRYRLALDG